MSDIKTQPEPSGFRRVIWLIGIALRLSLPITTLTLLIQFIWSWYSSGWRWSSQISSAGVSVWGWFLISVSAPRLEVLQPPFARTLNLAVLLLGVDHVTAPFPVLDQYRRGLPVAFLATSATLYLFGDYPKQTPEQKETDLPPGLFMGLGLLILAFAAQSAISR